MRKWNLEWTLNNLGASLISEQQHHLRVFLEHTANRSRVCYVRHTLRPQFEEDARADGHLPIEIGI